MALIRQSKGNFKIGCLFVGIGVSVTAWLMLCLLPAETHLKCNATTKQCAYSEKALMRNLTQVTFPFGAVQDVYVKASQSRGGTTYKVYIQTTQKKKFYIK